MQGLRERYCKILTSEIELKEKELSVIEENILLTKTLLFRLRTVLLTQEELSVHFDNDCFQSGFQKCINSNTTKSWVDFEKQFVDIDKPLLKTEPPGCDYDWSVESASQMLTNNEADGSEYSRFYLKRRVIVGNTSQFLKRSTRVPNSSATHKWMVYVRSGPNEPPLHTYVNCVRFFLHPTYSPHDIVQLTTPPYHLTRLGWGEFPIRVQLHFKDPTHKPVDIIHCLKLDNTRTGQQMLGSETNVDVELVRSDQVREYSDLASSNVPPQTKKHTISNVLLDHNYCTRQTNSGGSLEEDGSSAIWQILHAAAKAIPLTNRCKSLRVSGLQEINISELVKQRASEWMRAVEIKKLVQKTGMNGAYRITTKQVMVWCRMNGHTPFPKGNTAGGQSYCKHCGHLQHKQRNNSSCDYVSNTTSLSSVFDVFTGQSAVTDDHRVKLLQKFEVFKTPTISAHPYRVPRSPELKWVHQTCAGIGIYLYPQSEDGMLLHVVDHMVFSACSQFLFQLLRSVLALKRGQSFDWHTERIIVPNMICSVLRTVDEFDFLTDNGLSFL